MVVPINYNRRYHVYQLIFLFLAFILRSTHKYCTYRGIKLGTDPKHAHRSYPWHSLTHLKSQEIYLIGHEMNS